MPNFAKIGQTVYEKPYSGKLAIRPGHPRRGIKIKFCMGGSLRGVVVRFKFHQSRLSGFRDVGGRNLPFPITLAELIQQLVQPYKP